MNIEVTAAILKKDGKILLARRAPNKHLAGKWEFPGGKIEAGESPEQCLARELGEEFEIVAKIGDFVCESIFHYPEANRTIRLLAYEVAYVSGDFHLSDHDKIEWSAPELLTSYDLAPADIPIAVTYSSRYLG
jgi:mutator protein MutT